MATARDITQDNKPFIPTCTLCNREFKKPKLLPCQHSFCSQCLVKCHVKKKPFSCPTCHKDIKLANGRVDSLPDNYLFEIVRDTYGGMSPSDVKCAPCKEGKNITIATHKCLDCGDTLCNHCNEWHCRHAMSKHHVVVPLGELKKGKFTKEFTTRKTLNCNLHSTAEQKHPLSSYCQDCKCLVCVTCIQKEHKRHDFAELHNAREKHQVSLSMDFTGLRKSEKYQQTRIGYIENSITKRKQEWTEQETDIHDKAMEIHAIVVQMKEQKLAELKTFNEEELKRLKNLLEEEKCQHSILQATVAFSEAFLAQSSDSDFLCYEKDVKARMESSQIREKNNYETKVLSIERFNVHICLPLMKAIFGNFVSKKNVIFHGFQSATVERYKVPTHVKPSFYIGKTQNIFSQKVRMKGVYGIAYNSGTHELVLSGWSGSHALPVYNANGTFKRYIVCENANNSESICIKENEVYVTFYPKSLGCVSIVDAKGKIRKQITYPDDDQKKKNSSGIVIDRDNTIYITSSKKGRVYRMRQGDDTLTTFISKENGSKLNYPVYLCLTPSGELVVTNRGSSNIQVYSKEGILQWQYDGTKEGNGLQLPCGVCCDENGYIYVADPKNCRIQVIRDNSFIGNIPIDEETKSAQFVPIAPTPEGNIVYGYGDKLVHISFKNGL